VWGCSPSSLGGQPGAIATVMGSAGVVIWLVVFMN
jgi:hypothetical protein